MSNPRKVTTVQTTIRSRIMPATIRSMWMNVSSNTSTSKTHVRIRGIRGTRITPVMMHKTEAIVLPTARAIWASQRLRATVATTIPIRAAGTTKCGNTGSGNTIRSIVPSSVAIFSYAGQMNISPAEHLPVPFSFVLYKPVTCF